MELRAQLGLTASDTTGTNDHGCWLWPFGKTSAGYGVTRRRPQRYVHRIAWEWATGQSAEGLEVHHECHVRSCFNPEHLDGLDGRSHRHTHATADSCANGHPYPESKRPGRNDCAVCHRDAERLRQQRKKDALGPRNCSECGVDISQRRKDAQTCGDRCRSYRRRR